MNVPELFPEGQRILAELEGLPLPGDPRFDLQASRRGVQETAPRRVEGLDIAGHADVLIAGVRCRWYEPQSRAGERIVIHAHGGGFVEGGIDSHDAVCHALAALAGAPVLAIDYDLAPEARYPRQIEQFIAVVRAVADAQGVGLVAERLAGSVGIVGGPVSWLLTDETHERFEVDDGTQLIALGDSAGASLIAGALQYDAALAGELAAQVLVYPGVAEAFTAEQRELGARFALTEESVLWYGRQYCPDDELRQSEPALNPWKGSFAGQPRALIVTAACDPLAVSGERLAATMASAQVEVVCVQYAGTLHGFWRRPGESAIALAAVRQAAGFIRSV
ncbi:alpha/beta hydrolase fold domain-containing protein [Micrococcales bacterium 31B]|nr:alpha/beta hydrolase fold domain-containing protein [Micrococcales bacterium 31B]